MARLKSDERGIFGALLQGLSQVKQAEELSDLFIREGFDATLKAFYLSHQLFHPFHILLQSRAGGVSGRTEPAVFSAHDGGGVAACGIHGREQLRLKPIQQRINAYGPISDRPHGMEATRLTDQKVDCVDGVPQR